MRALNKLATHIIGAQRGYARSEILMVTAVAVLLSAVMIPRLDVERFKNPGIKTSKKAELQYVRTAMQAMMSANAATTIDPNDASNDSVAINVWKNIPSGNADVTTLDDYLASATTTYYYCYDSNGAITEQFERPSACSIPQYDAPLLPAA